MNGKARGHGTALTFTVLIAWTCMGCLCQETIPVQTFKSLHSKIYESMTISQKDQLYDFLANIFTKEGIEHHFARIGKFHDKKISDEIKITIDDIEYGNVDISGNVVTVNWIVRGRIRHSQHLHQRSLEYKAKYNVLKEAQGWKIVNSEVIEHADFELTDKERERGKSND